MPLVETLEARQHLSAQQIEGIVRDSSGQSQTAFADVTVFADANANSTLDEGEAFTSTDDTGHFTIETDLDPQQLRVIPPQGFEFDFVNAIPGSPVLLYLSPIRAINGVVYYDKNKDNQFNSGENTFAGLTVFLDSNRNNHLDNGEDTTITDADGRYTLMTSGWIGYVRLIVPAGWLQKENAQLWITGATDLLLAPAPGISGKVYNDLNLDTTLQNGEDGVPDTTVFIDDNDNGAVDAGELSTVTDANGDYSFPVVSERHYFTSPEEIKVRVLGLDSRLVLRPTSYVAVAPDYSYTFNIATYQTTTVSGVVFQDDNRNGLRDEGELGIAGIGVRSALKYGGPIGYGSLDNGYWADHLECYTRCNLPSYGAVVVGSVRELYQFTSADGSFIMQDMPLTNQSISVGSGFVRTSPDQPSGYQQIGALRIPQGKFGVAEVHGRIFDDLNKNGLFDSGEMPLPAMKIALYGARQEPFPIFSAFSGAINVIPPPPIAATTTDADGNFLFAGLRQGDYRLTLKDNFVPIDGTPVTFSLNPIDSKTIDFPADHYCTVSGNVVYTDGGYPDYHMKVYLDLNNNKKRDSGEPSQATDQGSYHFDHVPNGPFTVRVNSEHSRLLGPLPSGVAAHAQQIVNPDIQMDHPFSTTPIRVYLDLNTNGRKDPSEPYVDKVLLELDLDNDGAVDPYSRTYHFRTSQGQYSFRFPWGTSHITVRTFPNVKIQYAKTVRVNITDPAKPPRLLIGLRRQRQK